MWTIFLKSSIDYVSTLLLFHILFFLGQGAYGILALQPREILTPGWPRKSPPCVCFTPLALSPFPFLFSPASCAGHRVGAISWPDGHCSRHSGPRHLPTALHVSGGTASFSNYAFLSGPFQAQPCQPHVSLAA